MNGNRIPERLSDQLVRWRRDFHKYPESGWCEFRTTSIVVRHLESLSWATVFGRELHEEEYRLGVPSPEALAAERERAVAQGGDPELVDAMGDGFTGVLGVFDTGRPGPVVCFRFDMDCNEIDEWRAVEHRPYAEGFASVNAGKMHGCGHDGHTAMGMGLAAYIAAHAAEFSGSIKIIFQPAEEGVRGAHSIVAAGWLDDVDLFVATHLDASEDRGSAVTGADQYLATTKFDVEFMGVGSHAGGDPEKGRNALLAAATATVNLHAIARHSDGASRINVGTLHSGQGRNVVPRYAALNVETRGASSDVNSYMFESAKRVVAGAAEMQQVDHSVTVVGFAERVLPSSELLPFVHECFTRTDGVTTIRDSAGGNGSEDATAMMRRVKEKGGLATYVQIGMNTSWGHHTERFDVDEGVLQIGVESEFKIALYASDFLKEQKLLHDANPSAGVY